MEGLFAQNWDFPSFADAEADADAEAGAGAGAGEGADAGEGAGAVARCERGASISGRWSVAPHSLARRGE